MSLFSAVELAPRDPILGMTEQFNADSNPAKVNLGVGVYFDEQGKLPILACVAEAEARLARNPKPKGYLPIDGIAAYDKAVQELVFGAGHPAVRDGRIATVQTLGGTGGLKVGADFLKQLRGDAVVYISDPSWENHRALFSQAGFQVHSYPYYDADSHGVRFEAMLDALGKAAPGSIVVLHACCHNPTGCDLDVDQWSRVVHLMQARALVPFLDMAYQGFGEGLAEDAQAVRLFVESGMDFFVSTSFSKSFSLYGERVGALSVVCDSRDAAVRVLSRLKVLIRSNYSNPPTHGAQLVTMVLTTPELRSQWEQELGGIRQRIRSLRELLVQRLAQVGVEQDMAFVTRQKGMFSYSGLSVAAMQRLRSEFGIYGLDSGRICVAALNSSNIDRVAAAIARVA